MEAYAEPAKQENMQIMKRRKKKRWRWGWWRPAKTLRRVQLNSPNGLAYHLFTHMLSVQCCGLPHVTDFRILKIVSSPSSGVLNNHKGEILPFCSETKIEISVCVPSLTRAHNPPICKPSNFGEEQQQQVRNSNFYKKLPYFF